MIRRLIIDALPFAKGKAFGYQEYLFNLLNYINDNVDSLKFAEIIIVCKRDQISHFERFTHLRTKGYRFEGIFKRIYVQNKFVFDLNLTKWDVILFTGNYSSLIKRAKHVLVIHDLLYLRKNLLPKSLMRWQRKVFMPVSASLADHIIAISDFTKQDIIEKLNISPTKVSRIYNYFNFSKYDSNLISVKEDYFLSVSSSEAHKNLVMLLNAFELFCRTNYTTSLYLVSNLKGNDLFTYNNLAGNIKNRIKIIKNVNNQQLGVLYGRCKAYISTSLFEGLGMPVVEAMYFHCHLIISDIEVFREITCGDANFFNPNSAIQLSELMMFFKTRNPKLQEMALSNFSVKNTSEQYLNLLNEC